MYCKRLISILVALLCNPPSVLEGMSFRALTLDLSFCLVPVDVVHIPFSSILQYPSNYALWETRLYHNLFFFC